jgi:hypothetical protein
MTFREFLPHWAVAILFAAFWIAGGESGQLLQDRVRDPVYVRNLLERKDLTFVTFYGEFLFGAETWFGMLVNVTFWLGLLFLVAFPIAYGYDNGWQPAIGLLLMAILAHVLYVVCGSLSWSR